MSSSGGGGASLASQIQQFVNQIINERFSDAKINGVLLAAGQAGLQAANPRTPVRTGNLQRGNAFEAGNMSLTFHNDVEYAGYVNYGTSRQPPAHFFDAGIEAIKAKLDQDLAKL